MESIDEKRARIKAEREKLRADTEARDKARADEDALAAEELALANEQAIAKAESEHGRICDGKIGAVETRLGVVIVKRPQAAFHRRFMKGTNGHEDAEKLVRHCLVHPSPVAFDALLEEQPGVLDAITVVCAHLAGLGAKEVAGK